MTGKLPASASVARAAEGQKLHAPAAARNSDALVQLLRDHASAHGEALELASGTGQHVVAFARAFPELVWYPSEINPERRASIDAYRAEADLPNIEPVLDLNATLPGWGASHGGKTLILLINLLHLIPTEQARTLLCEAMQALGPSGCFILYGPFKRSGALISEGDATFHAQLSQADPAIGYKNDTHIEDWLRQAGASHVVRVEMPANNLAFIATR